MTERDYVNEGWTAEDCYPKEYPPCRICNGPNDMGEVCAKCAKTNNYFDAGDTEASGGWMIQSGHGRP